MVGGIVMRWRAGRFDERRERRASPRLTVELVPETCSLRSLRAELLPEEWDRLERLVLQRARNCCETCGHHDDDRRLECEELWSYDDDRHVQRLERVMALCPACREVRHIDLAARMGTADRAARHLAKVNGWDESAAEQHIALAYQQWEERSCHVWSPDVGRLRDDAIDPPVLADQGQPSRDYCRPGETGLIVHQVEVDTLDQLAEQLDRDLT